MTILHRFVSLRAKVARGGAALAEEAAAERLDEVAEDELGTTFQSSVEVPSSNIVGDLPSLREGHPENQDKLESVVEGCDQSGIGQSGGSAWTYGTSRRR